MDRFVNLENIERYKWLASGTISVAQRKKLLDLLAEEMANFIEIQKSESSPGHYVQDERT